MKYIVYYLAFALLFCHTSTLYGGDSNKPQMKSADQLTKDLIVTGLPMRGITVQPSVENSAYTDASVQTDGI